MIPRPHHSKIAPLLVLFSTQNPHSRKPAIQGLGMAARFSKPLAAWPERLFILGEFAKALSVVGEGEFAPAVAKRGKPIPHIYHRYLFGNYADTTFSQLFVGLSAV